MTKLLRNRTSDSDSAFPKISVRLFLLREMLTKSYYHYVKEAQEPSSPCGGCRSAGMFADLSIFMHRIVWAEAALVLFLGSPPTKKTFVTDNLFKILLRSLPK